MQKLVFGYIRTAKAQIRVHIHAVCSRPSQSANRIHQYWKMYEWNGQDDTLCECMMIWICACSMALFHLIWPVYLQPYYFISLQDPSGRVAIEVLGGGLGPHYFGIRYVSNFSVEVFVKNHLMSGNRNIFEYEVCIIWIILSFLFSSSSFFLFFF